MIRTLLVVKVIKQERKETDGESRCLFGRVETLKKY